MKENVRPLIKIFFCTLPMGFSAFFICSLGNWTTTGNVLEKIIILFIGIVVGLGVYLACSYWMKNEAMIFLVKMVRRKR